MAAPDHLSPGLRARNVSTAAHADHGPELRPVLAGQDLLSGQADLTPDLVDVVRTAVGMALRGMASGT